MIPVVSNMAGILILSFCQESPVYLLMKNEEANDCLQWYREVKNPSKDDEERLESELVEMKSQVLTYSQGATFNKSIKVLVEKDNLKAGKVGEGLIFTKFQI